LAEEVYPLLMLEAYIAKLADIKMDRWIRQFLAVDSNFI
jgi:hypothetical protein